MVHSAICSPCRDGAKKNAIEGYLKRLGELYDEWRQLNEKITTNTTDLEMLRQRIATLKETAQKQMQLTNDCRSKCSQLREQLAEHREEIVRMFGQDTPQSLAEKLQRNI